MSIEWSCEFIATKDSTSKWGKWGDIDIQAFCSNEREFRDWIEFECDFYFEDDRLEALEDGDYWVYARGTSEFESDIDWESGIDEGGFRLDIDNLVTKKLDERYLPDDLS